MLIVIPARGGSKGLPRKNLQRCAGISLLERAIFVGKHLSTTVVVTSDDVEILELAQVCGAIPRLARPPKCHGDDSRAVDVWKDAWESIEVSRALANAPPFEFSAYLEPTCPQRTPEMVSNALELLRLARDKDVAVSVEAVPWKYHGAKQIDDRGNVQGPSSIPRQRLDPRWIRNGAFYIARRRAILSAAATIFPVNRVLHIDTGPLVNIDTADDLRRAEFELTR